MSRAFPVLLLCLALALGGVLYVEARSGPPGTDASEPGAARVAELVRPARRAPADNAGPLVATILARPLFSPTRRPAATSAGPVKAAAEMPRLAGVLVSDAGSGAIFARPGEKATVVHAGDRIGPYQVTSISAGEVTLLGPAGPITMHPVFANAAESPAAAPASAPVARPFYPRSAPAQVGIPSLAEVQNMIAKQQAEAPK